jgi:hypothetical protein
MSFCCYNLKSLSEGIQKNTKNLEEIKEEAKGDLEFVGGYRKSQRNDGVLCVGGNYVLKLSWWIA